MAEYLDKTGLTYLWSKIKAKFDAKADKTALDAKADKTALDAKADKTALDAKADKTTADALGKRIDNLILSSGTESSAEVVDARTGYDGTAHDTLGTAIRKQVSELKGDLSNVADIVGGLPSLVFVRGIIYQGKYTTDSSNCIAMENYVILDYDVTISIKDGYRYGFQKVVPTGTVVDEYGNSTSVLRGTTTGENTFTKGVPFRLYVTKNGSSYNVPCDINELKYALSISSNNVKNILDTRIYNFVNYQIDSASYSKQITDYPIGKITIEKIGYNTESVFPTYGGILYTFNLNVISDAYQIYYDSIYRKDIYRRGFYEDGTPKIWAKDANEVDLKLVTSDRTPKRHKRGPIISILDDDGSVQMYNKMFPLAKKYGIPMCQALCTYYIDGNDDREVGEYVTWKQIEEMSKYGFEFLTHSYRHKDYTSLTDSEIVNEMKIPITNFKNHSINVRGLSYPNGKSNPKVRQYASQFYDYAVMGETPNQEFRVNTGHIPSYYIHRSIIGSYFDRSGVVNGVNVVNPNDTPNTEEYVYTNSLEYYKMVIDECVENNGWLVIETHCWHPDMDDTQWSYFEDVIKYAKSLGVSFLTCGEAYDYFKNAYESGDYLGYWNDTYDYQTGLGGHGIAIDQDGNIDVPANKYDSTVTEWNWNKFPNNRISIYRIYDNTLTKIPEMSGIIEVHKTTDPIYSFEMFYPTLTNNVYQRKFNSNGVPQSWVKIMGN